MMKEKKPSQNKKKDLVSEFTSLVSIGAVLEDDEKRQLLNKILSSKKTP